jgi:hypothetical protein
MNIWVNSSTGNDTLNDGTEFYPYLTPTRAFADVPYEIRHKVKIRLTGNFTDWPKRINNRIDYEWDGALNIDASGNTFPVLAGPFTIQGLSDLGQNATDITVSGSPGWTTNQYYGRFIRFKSGVYNGLVMGIWKNDTNTIRTFWDAGNLSNGDTFEIVDCPVTVTLDHSVIFEGTNWEVGDVSYWANLQICGIKFVITPQTIEGHFKSMNPFSVLRQKAIITFCSIVDTRADSFLGIYYSQRSETNNAYVYTNPLFDDPLLHDWQTLTLNVIHNNYNPITYLQVGAIMEDSIVRNMQTRGVAWLQSGGSVSVFGGMCGQIYNKACDYAAVGGLVEQIGWSDDGIQVFNGYISINNVWIENAPVALRLKYNAFVRGFTLKGNTVSDNYACHVGDGCSFIIFFDTVTILGAVGAVKFEFDGSTHAAWPGAGVSYTDGAGSYVNRKP